jgi:hypothetical protein
VINGNLNIENSVVSSVNVGAFSFKMSVKYTGEITISDEESKEFSQTIFYEDAFNGLELGDFGVFVEGSDVQPVTVSLKGLAIYSGVLTEKISYWTEIKEDEVEKLEDEEKTLIKVETKQRNMTTARLSLTGAPEAICNEISASTVDFQVALKELFEHTESWSGKAELPETPAISDIQIVDSVDDLETEFEIARVIENGAYVNSCETMLNGKVIALRREAGAKKVVVDIEFNPEEEEKKDRVDKGTIRDVKIAVTSCQADKILVKQPIRDLVFIKTCTPQAIELPNGFQMFVDDGKARNFAAKEDAFYLFLAYRTSEVLLGWPIKPLSAAGATGGTFGMVD